jgi:hypothetical protein
MIVIELYDYVDIHGRNIIPIWLIEDRISRRDKAKLSQKLDALVRIEPELALHTKLVAKVSKGILKLRVHGEVQLRPMLCRGPIDDHGEYTLLAGAVETGGRLPAGVMDTAFDRRQHVKQNPGKHRCSHVHFE